MSFFLGALRIIGYSPNQNYSRSAMLSQTWLFPLSATDTTIGSSISSAIIIQDPAVPAEFATIQFRDPSWFIEGAAEVEEISVNDQNVQVSSAAPLAPGDIFQAGSVLLQLVAPQYRGETAAATTPALQSYLPLLQRTPLQDFLKNRRWLLMVLGFSALSIFLSAIVDVIGVILYPSSLIFNINIIVALTAPLAPVFGVLGLIGYIDRHERHSWRLQVIIFLWGLIVAPLISDFIEQKIRDAIFMLPLDNLPRIWMTLLQNILLSFNAGFFEECAKGIILLIIMFWIKSHIRNAADGILYGVIVGAGFGLIENIMYIASADSLPQLLTLIVGRVILGWLGHSTFTACFGAYIGMEQENPDIFRPWLKPLIGFSAACGIHTLFDFFLFEANSAQNYFNTPAFDLLAGIFFVALAYLLLFSVQIYLLRIIFLSLSQQNAVLREYLWKDVVRGIITPEEYVIVQHVTLRQRLDRSLLLAYNFTIWRAVKNTLNDIVSLAFVLQRIHSGAHNSDDIALSENLRSRIMRSHELLAIWEQFVHF